jgi:3-hydroxybutyryl-CoA dehydrogenase
MQLHRLLISGNSLQVHALLQKHLPEEWQMQEWTWETGTAIPADTGGIIQMGDPLALSWERIPENIPILVHDVCGLMNDYPITKSIARFNAWPGFLESSILEFTTRTEHRTVFEQWLDAMGWKYQCVADLPGLIRPRVLSMIINEACFAFGEGVSSKEEIDLAMKYGTNYPMGPFEWAGRIGTEPLVQLLETLARADQRYQPAPDMRQLLNA